MDNPKDIQEQIGSPEGLRKAVADHIREKPKICRDLFKYQAGLRQLAPLQVPRMGWVHEHFDRDYLDTCKKISALEQKLTTNKAITPQEKAKDKQALVQLTISKKALEEEGNKKDEELARSFVRLGTSTGVFLSSLPLVGPISATAAGIGAAHLSQGNEFEIIKQVLLFGAVGKVFEKLRKIPIINQPEGKVLAWVRNHIKQGEGVVQGGNSIGNTTTTSLVPCKIAKAAQKIANGEYSITKTVAKNLPDRPYINSPGTIKNIIFSNQGTPDKYFQGGMNWKVLGEFNGSKGIYELGMNPETGVIYHFLFRTVK